MFQHYRRILLIILAIHQLRFTSILIESLHQHDYEIIYPDITSNHNRNKRDLKENSKHDNVRIKFKAFNQRFDAKLALNEKLIIPRAEEHVLGDNGNKLHAGNLDNCFYHGKLSTDNNSFVSLAYCNGLLGMIQTNNTRYSLEPSSDFLLGKNARSPHIIRMMPRENASSTYGWSMHREAIETDVTSRLRLKRDLDPNNLGEQTIETMLVVDQKMVQYHGLDAARQYALVIASTARNILRHPSIGTSSINLVVVKMVVLVAEQKNLHISHHASNTLASFGEWVGLQSDNNDAADHFDYAVLITRYDICKDREEPCDNMGLSVTGGMCRSPTSVSVIKDNGLSSGFTLAHQIGHSLGIEHDGRGNSCNGQNSIMSEYGGHGKGVFSWSSCSANYLQQFLRTEQAKCLANAPSQDKRESSIIYRDPGTIYDVNAQCKLFAGQIAKGCYYSDLDEICVELLCFLPNMTSCASTGKPSADGTSCGNKKFCKHGRCIDEYDREIIHGDWSAWSEFSTCTRPCGGGIMYKTRRCDNPKPRNGGKFCEGDSRKYVLCNKEPCLDSAAVNFRKQQCQSNSGKFLGDVSYSWTFDTKNEEFGCNLECTAETNSNIKKNFGVASDGTNCFKKNFNLPGRCVAGDCISIGCDFVLGSKEKKDRCGICKGDGSTCNARYNIESLKSNDSANIVNETEAARERSPSSSVANITNATVPVRESNQTLKKNISDVINRHTVDKKSNETGVDHLPNVLQKLRLLRHLMKIVVSKRCSNDKKCLERYHYLDLKHKKDEISRPKDFEWAILSSGCSVTCGTGTITLYSDCRRVDDGSTVGRKFCMHQTEPTTKTKACRMPECVARWSVGSWSPCSKPCDSGIQSRAVNCIKTIYEDFYLPSSMCNPVTKPALQQTCNEKKCLGKWMAEPFGQCSTSCGRGTQVRDVACKLRNEDQSLMIVDDSHCNAAEKPERELACNLHNPCPGDDSCGRNFTRSNGVITSPAFPDFYPNNKDCIYEISVAPEKIILLDFLKLKISGPTDEGTQCGGDFLRITDGSCYDARSLPYTMYCGLNLPSSAFISSTSKVCLKFVSDNSQTNQGFALKYMAVDKRDNERKLFDICDPHEEIINSAFGSITSPNYPDAYPANEYCKLTVSYPNSGGFIVSFKGFDVGTRKGGSECVDDYLQIDYDEISTEICGQGSQQISIKSDVFTVTFHSVNYLLGGTGFVMTFITKWLMRRQFQLIKLRENQEMQTNTMLANVMRLPSISSVASSSLKQPKQESKTLIEALTDLKKNVINYPSNTSQNYGSIKDSATLKNVLDLLSGASLQRSFSNVKAGSPRLPNQQKPNPALFEDYTKAKIVRKTSILGNAINQGSKYMKFPEVPSRPFNGRLPVLPNNQQNFKRFKIQASQKISAIKQRFESLSNAEKWARYWNTYKRHYVERNWSRKACPLAVYLPCKTVATFYACHGWFMCDNQQRMQCCATSCPYKPYVCTWN